jgi:hypothetical protein
VKYGVGDSGCRWALCGFAYTKRWHIVSRHELDLNIRHFIEA